MKNHPVIKFFTSIKLNVVVLAFSTVLVFLGTVAQEPMGLKLAVDRFFKVFFVDHIAMTAALNKSAHLFFDIKPEPVPQWELVREGVPAFPGGYLLGSLLLLGLLGSYYTRFVLSWKKLGIVLTHLGIIILLLGQVLTDILSVESYIRMEAGERVNYSVSHDLVELAVEKNDVNGTQVVSIPGESLRKGGVITHPAMEGVRIKVLEAWPNARLVENPISLGKLFADETADSQAVLDRINSQLTVLEDEMAIRQSGYSLGHWRKLMRELSTDAKNFKSLDAPLRQPKETDEDFTAREKKFLDNYKEVEKLVKEVNWVLAPERYRELAKETERTISSYEDIMPSRKFGARMGVQNLIIPLFKKHRNNDSMTELIQRQIGVLESEMQARRVAFDLESWKNLVEIVSDIKNVKTMIPPRKSSKETPEQFAIRTRQYEEFQEDFQWFIGKFKVYVTNARIHRIPKMEHEFKDVKGVTRRTLTIAEQFKIIVELDLDFGMDGRNYPAAALELSRGDGVLGTWLVSTRFEHVPQQVDGSESGPTITLRNKRFYHNHTFTLKDLKWDKYPGTSMTRNYQSSVLVQPNAGTAFDAEIYMNHPLRIDGLTHYQHQLGPAAARSSKLFTQLAVVQNPGWLTPYFGCLVVACGMLYQFLSHLVGFVGKRRSK